MKLGNHDMPLARRLLWAHAELLSHSFSLSLSPRLSWIHPHLQAPEGRVRSFSQLLIASAGNRKELGHPVDLSEFVFGLCSRNMVCVLE